MSKAQTAKILNGKVHHSRYSECRHDAEKTAQKTDERKTTANGGKSPRNKKLNSFTYQTFYLSLPLKQLGSNTLPLKIDQTGLISFHQKDHGPKDGTSLERWAREQLANYNLNAIDGEITLLAMPRIAGYVFNPVSFWFCHDKTGNLRAVIAEVNNTFGEQHCYICAHDDQRVITAKETITAKKLFHVSPFLKREGRYKFRFNSTENSFSAAINLYSENNELILGTSLKGKFQELTQKNLRRAQWRTPFITLKTIMLIHWQAVKLFLKGIPYQMKPKQLSPRISNSERE